LLRRCLLVLDDVWSADHLREFDVLSSSSQLLLTTREGSLLTGAGAVKEELDVLTQDESLWLISRWSGRAAQEFGTIADNVVQECGFLPLALTVCGAMIRDGVPSTDILSALRDSDLSFISHQGMNYVDLLDNSVEIGSPDEGLGLRLCSPRWRLIASYASLVEADLTNADLTHCRVYGISAWGLTLTESTRQRDLVITDANQSEVTVDNIEIAQFVYLLLHNENIREVLGAVTSKAVLILGRFTSERTAILHALREELRRRGYAPILMDFDKPVSKDLTGTVSTLAHMAQFIIADVTDPSSIPHELAFVGANVVIPIQPILMTGKSEFAMFADMRWRYHWVLPTYHYDSPEGLIADLSDRVIRPAEAKVLELRAPANSLDRR